MNKILLALTILSAGAGTFLTARQSTTRLQHEAKDTRETWLVQTQLVAVAQGEEAGLIERVRELKQALAQPPAVAESALWSALQTSRSGRLPPELRERLLEELGFNWKSSSDFIVVCKETVREIQMHAIEGGKLTDLASTVLALTPEERSQVEAAVQRVPTDFKDWAVSHVERSEPKDDIVAQYTLLGDPAMTVSNNCATGLFDAVGQERAELILPSARNWMINTIGFPEEPTRMIVKRYLVGSEQRLKVQLLRRFGTPRQSGYANLPDLSKPHSFPEVFRPVFPNGWADVAKREGFELPEESQEK